MADAKLPKVHIPMAVDTRGVDAGLKAAEAKLRASTKRMAEMQGRAGGFSISGGKLGEAVSRTGMTLGGIGALGAVAGALGPIGLAAGAIAGVATLINQIGESARGAGKALDQFRETGEQTFAVNSVILERLARAEKELPKVGFFDRLSQGIVAGGETAEGPSGIVGFFKDVQDAIVQTATGISALTSGKSFSQAAFEAQLATTQSESDARSIETFRQFAGLLDQMRSSRQVDEQAVLDARRRNI